MDFFRFRLDLFEDDFFVFQVFFVCYVVFIFIFGLLGQVFIFGLLLRFWFFGFIYFLNRYSFILVFKYFKGKREIIFIYRVS